MTRTSQAVANRIKGAGSPVTRLSAETGIAEKTLRRRLAAPEQFTLAELSALARAIGMPMEDLLATQPSDAA